MTQSKFIPALFLTAAIALPAVAASDRVSITPQQVAQAINGTGMNVSADQVVLLTDVLATNRAPGLKVVSMQRWGDRQIKFRLDCVKADECLPFFVAVRWSQAQPMPSVFAGTSSTAMNPAESGSNSFVVHTGSSAVLLLEGDHIHIQLPVVCLENGAIGQTIRVASPDRRQTYRVQVGNDAVLRGKL
jgi:hypothetical protein